MIQNAQFWIQNTLFVTQKFWVKTLFLSTRWLKTLFFTAFMIGQKIMTIMLVMEGLVIFDVCLWPDWLEVIGAWWSPDYLRNSSDLCQRFRLWWLWLMVMMVIDNDDDDDNYDYPLRSASSSLSFFCGVLSLASSSKDGVVCYYQSCNCQIICFFPPSNPRLAFNKLVLQVFLSLCQCKRNWSFIEVFDWLIKPFNLRVHCVFGNVFIVSTFNI